MALVTGANHGIGAATAKALAAQGTAVLCAYFRNERQGGLDDPSLPAAYRATRMARADFVVESIRAAGGRAAAVEADLSDAASVPALFDAAEARARAGADPGQQRLGLDRRHLRPRRHRPLRAAQAPLSARTIDQVFAVDARAAALLIAEFARRHVARRAQWGRIIGLTSGEADGFPEEVSYGAAKAAQVNFTLSAATELAALRRHRQRRPPADDRHRMGRPGDGALRPVRRPARWPRPGRWPRSSPTWPRTPRPSSPATSSGSAESADAWHGSAEVTQPPSPQGTRPGAAESDSRQGLASRYCWWYVLGVIEAAQPTRSQS